MFKFFEPKSKVQKNRQIIRQTDARMAKYSRRGIISNFLVYVLCMLFSQTFIEDYQRLTIVLTIGLLVITAVRGYLLFRFEAIYPRAPAAWRNKYFLVTLIGASWWGLIMTSITLVLDLEGIAPLMWLYTVVFFSSTAHAFAPYPRFLAIYQFLGLVPAACSAFFIGEFIGVLYAGIILLFYWIIKHQCDLMADSYWDQLDANYVLARNALSLEEQKRDSRASVSLSKDYITLLKRQMHALIKPAVSGDDGAPPTPITVASQKASFEKIYRNVEDFHQVLTKELELEPRIFNIRDYIQSVVSQAIPLAEKKGIEVETSLSPVLPFRLSGDAGRIGQIIGILLDSAIQQKEEGYILVEVEFVREYENTGELHLTLVHQGSPQKRSFFHDQSEASFHINLDLLLAKGVAESLNGSLEIGDMDTREVQNIRLRIPLKIAEVDVRSGIYKSEFRGKSLLLIHPLARWLDHKRAELDALGFEVDTSNDFKKAFQLMLNALNSNRAVEVVVYSTSSSDDAAIQFCNDLISHNDLKFTHQFIICSERARKVIESNLVQDSSFVHFIRKPSGVFEFEMMAKNVFDSSMNEEPIQGAATPELLWVSPHKDFALAEKYESEIIKVHTAADLKQAVRIVEAQKLKLIVVQSSEPDDSLLPLVQGLLALQDIETTVPLAGVSSEEMRGQMLALGVDHFVSQEDAENILDNALIHWLNESTN